MPRMPMMMQMKEEGHSQYGYDLNLIAQCRTGDRQCYYKANKPIYSETVRPQGSHCERGRLPTYIGMLGHHDR